MESPWLTRRQALQAMGVMLLPGSLPAKLAGVGGSGGSPQNDSVVYGKSTLPIGIRSRYVDNGNGATLHVLEAGFEVRGRPCVVLLHGFPELAYTWRHQLLPLARVGFHVIAPDLRGYGRSAAAPISFDDDLLAYSCLNRVADVLGTVRALGHAKVAAVIGHDWGSPLAAWCALIRPDVFQSVVLMSTPFGGIPTPELNSANHAQRRAPELDIEEALATLPRPRKHYWWYSATPKANEDMWHAPQGVHDLLRAMYYFKSADWKGNRPFVLKSWTAAELAKLPTYYVMDLDKGIAETMAAQMPSKAQIAACRWMTEADLSVYAGEYMRTGFQGGLNAYRVLTDRRFDTELNPFAGRTIDVPSLFIGGAADWGVRQTPGSLEAMQRGACTRLLGVNIVAGVGHSVPEERPAQVTRLLVEFLRSDRAA